MGVLCIQRVLSHGWRAGAATGAGIASADALFAGLAAFGLTALSQLLVSFQTPLRIGGGLVLVWLGWRAIVTPPAHEAAVAGGGWRAGSLYASAFALTLTNPMTIMAFGAVFASAGLTAEATLASAGVATLGVALGLALVVARAQYRRGADAPQGERCRRSPSEPRLRGGRGRIRAACGGSGCRRASRLGRR